MKISDKVFGIIGIFMIAVFVITVIVSIFLGRREDKLIREMRSQPIVYTYTTYGEGIQIPSMASNDLECLKQTKIQYDSFKVGIPKYEISCVERYIYGDEPVYLLDNGNGGEFGSEYVRIALFYKSRNGFDRYYVGYVLRTTIHRTPYKKRVKKGN